MSDIYNLRRFTVAQEGIYAVVLDELRVGRKQSHWMWYIFPQIQGLGGSSTAQRYAIASGEEAAAYLQHPVLGPRLNECTTIVNGVQGRSAEQIFSFPDYLKFRSCMTLFQRFAKDSQVFQDALDKYFCGQPDSMTLDILAEQAGGG